MAHPTTLPISLADHSRSLMERGPAETALGEVIEAVAAAIVEISALVALGDLAGALGDAAGANSDGDVQKIVDVLTHAIVMRHLAYVAAAVASEEAADIEVLDPSRPYAVAIDPLDGSSNIDTAMSIGTIFSVVPSAGVDLRPLGPFGRPGSDQVAAGFAIYGPQTILVVTWGDGVDIFTLDPRDRTFRLTRPNVRIPAGRPEYAINASNFRHWEGPVQTYVDDCLKGSEGVRGQDFNMRWIGSLVAEAFRILTRGGIFLYPADTRKSYRNGRLRLVYEAAPMAFLMEQAGGRATTGRSRILDLAPETLHQRVPLIFGAADKVERVERLHRTVRHESAEHAPLFGTRGLFR